MKATRLAKVILASTAIAWPLSAMAQPSQFARDRSVSVRERPRPDYEAPGVRVRSFLLQPRVAIDSTFDDNIYATRNGPIRDVIWRARPELTIVSDWSRHLASVFARASVNRYEKNPTEDSTDYAYGARGRLDVGRASSLTLNLARLYSTEPRSSPSSPRQAAAPVRYYTDQATAIARVEGNRLRFTGRGGYSRFDYESVARIGGGVLSQDARDRRVTSEALRVDYAVSDATSIYVNGALNQRNYALESPPAVTDRDSHGYEAAVGINFERPALMRGEVEVGYLEQTFDSQLYSTISGASLRMSLDWFPTQLTTLNLQASQSIEDAVIIGAAGYLATSGQVRFDHELRRNIILTGTAGYEKDVYQGIDRTDQSVTSSLAATYLLNRNVGVTTSYNYLDRRSDGSASNLNFTDNRVTGTLIIQF